MDVDEQSFKNNLLMIASHSDIVNGKKKRVVGQFACHPGLRAAGYMVLSKSNTMDPRQEHSGMTSKLTNHQETKKKKRPCQKMARGVLRETPLKVSQHLDNLITAAFPLLS